MAEARVPNPLVEQFRKGGIPKDLRLMAAQGALPLKPADLVELLHFLLTDAETDVKTAAGTALLGVAPDEMRAICADRTTPPPILAWAIAYRPEKELREAALQNTNTADADITALAPSLSTELAELVVINQTRLLRSLVLLEAIESNPSLNNDQKRRLRELRETFRIGLEDAPPPAPPAPPAPVVEAAPEEPEAPEPPPPTSDGEAVTRYLTEEEQQETEKVSAVQRLYRRNTAAKVVAALKGSREERAVLIRDPNRIVSSAVLGSPKLTEAEIESISAMKNVSAEILRQIGNNKDFVKRYSILSNLVKNPRTPLAVSIGMVPRLNPRDMKSVAIDRNVPEVIRKQALKFVRQVGDPGGAGGGGGKH
jgi:hypothetical protein